MPGTVADGPTVSLSFANNFWGKDDAGVGPMLERMHGSKLSCDELKIFYNIRAAIEDEYARKLMALCRKPLGSSETGSLRASFDVVRGETEAIAKSHLAIAGQMKRELEEPLIAFAGGSKERRKIIQTGIERLHKNKFQQTQTVNKTRDRYEQDCLRIKGYLAQGHMVMGQEERKNKAKLEKTQIQLASSSSEYEAAVKVLEETTGRWNKEWKAACDKFQDLEEERLDFTKSSLWAYANIASTVCVSDDASCEKIRLSLENCEVEKDIVYFIKERGTGQDIPDPPRFINFARGDTNDTSSEISEEDGYSVAQFQRTINPAYRSSSPQPSTYESHHDPELEPEPEPEPAPMPQQTAPSNPPNQSSRESTVTPQKAMQQPPPLDLRRGGHPPPNYDPNRHGEISMVPHNAYPTDGMTMFCRTGPPSEQSSAVSSNGAYRPSSRGSQSEVSNPTSVSSQEPVSATSGKQSPTKPTNGVSLPGMGGDTQTQKKRSTFFSNSPFRRKSRHDKDRNSGSSQSPARGTWNSPSKPTSPIKAPQPQPQPQPQLQSQPRPQPPPQPQFQPQPRQPAPASVNNRISNSPEPADPRANFQLNVGNNVFDVASPDKKDTKGGAQPAKTPEDDLDPIARALADLKGVGKQSATRVSADRYHGIATPQPQAAAAASQSNVNSNSVATPPPAYNDSPVKRLDAPQPAFTSSQMQRTTQKYTGQTQNMFRGAGASPGMAPRSSASSQEVPRARSPIAPRRSASPQVSPRVDTRASQYSRGASPSPSTYQSNSVNSRYSQHSPSVSTPPQRPSDAPRSPGGYAASRASPSAMPRAVSPQPQFRQQARPTSASSARGMELQLSGQADPYGSSSDRYSRRGSTARPTSSYYNEASSQRSRRNSMAVADPGQQFSRDGRPILHFARALYSYTAAIPEELGFTKGDCLSVIRLQDDGWWEAEVTTARTRTGLVPSNYLQII